MKWSKSNLEAVVLSLTDYRSRVDSLMTRLSEDGNKFRRSPEFRDEMADAKSFFREEKKRLEREDRSFSSESPGFYYWAVRDAAVHFPRIDRPQTWFDGLYNVSFDLGYHLSGAENALREIKENSENIGAE